MDDKQLPDRIRSKSSEVILLVDEEDIVRNLGHVILEESGYVVLEARDGREALALCAGHQGPIDLLVTDLMIPELNGRELAERAIDLRPGLKVMFMSSRPDLVVQDGFHEGRWFLQKPFTPVGLAERVRKALDSNAPVPPDKQRN